MENNDLLKARAWVEIDLDNLEHNINVIKEKLHHDSKIMAVVKSNAYGHDDIIIAHKLNSIGIEDFAVASLEEGIKLRENNIKGNILILGYTPNYLLNEVIKYDLIQTIVDYDYLKSIDNILLDDKLKVHLKINTGMNRLGELYDNIDKILLMYENKKINVLGIYTHFSVSDSSSKDDIEFTQKQAQNFYNLISKIKEKGYNPGKIHLQSSYGFLNYNNLECDYVRIGIIMYGVYSNNNDFHLMDLDLKPVLSLKARVASIRTIKNNDSVGYGRLYKATSPRKIATVTIGYADGYPRALSNKEVYGQIGNKLVPLVGRVCMDQVMFDVTDIPYIKPSDIITLIGENTKISANYLANITNTITNELLSRLGNRLNYIFIDN